MHHYHHLQMQCIIIIRSASVTLLSVAFRSYSVVDATLVYGLWFGIHAGLPGVSGHVWHGDDEKADAAEEEEGEGGAGASEGPRIVVLDPYGLVAVNHAFDRLPHDLHRDDDAQTCEGEEGHRG